MLPNVGIGGENAQRFYKRKAGPHRDKRRRREGKRGRGRVREALRRGEWDEPWDGMSGASPAGSEMSGTGLVRPASSLDAPTATSAGCNVTTTGQRGG